MQASLKLKLVSEVPEIFNCHSMMLKGAFKHEWYSVANHVAAQCVVALTQAGGATAHPLGPAPFPASISCGISALQETSPSCYFCRC